MDGRQVALIASPFTGAAAWAPTAEVLRAAGANIITPAVSLEGLQPPFYPALARRISAELDPEADLVLVAHSGAGGLLPAIAEAVSARLHAAVFVDAILPHPGRCWFDTAPQELAQRLRSQVRDGRLPSWDQWFGGAILTRMLGGEAQASTFRAGLERVPVAYGAEPAPDCPNWPPRRCAYLQLSAGYASDADAATARDWQVRRDIIHHLATVTHADKVAESLHSMISAL
jgi:hypothetical protein